MREIITSLDLGSSTIKLVVGEMIGSSLSVLCCCEEKSKGIKKGVVVNSDETLIALKSVFKKAEEVIGIKINKVVMIIPSFYAEFLVSEGYSTITREDKEVKAEDVVRSLQACVYNKVGSNMELVNIMPVEFMLDEKEKTKAPIGKKAEKLSSKVVLSTIPKKNIFTVLNLLETLGVNVIDLSFSTLGDYYQFKKEEYKNKQGAIINIGSEKTEVGIINKGVLSALENLAYGGKNIDRDLSYIYNITRDSAKKLKENFALAHKKNALSNEIEEVVNKDGEILKINQYEITEIVHSRLREILDFSKKQINLLTKQEISYIIVTGGVSETSDFQNILDEVFNKNVKVSIIKEMGVRNNKYSSVIGLIKYYYDKLNFRGRVASTISLEEQIGLFNKKRKINENNLLGKIYGYFFDN